MKAGVLLAAMAFALPAAARVLDLHSEIRVAKSGEVTVTERITLEARQKDAKEKEQGLERELPRAAQVLDVIRNGHPEPYALEGERLRIGKAALPEGRHVYQLTYRSARRIAFRADHAVLQWKLAGSERITAEVFLPAAVPAHSIKAEVAGPESRAFVRDGRAAFRANETLTLVVRFPKGVVAEPGFGERALWLLDDHGGLAGVLLLLGACAAALFHLNRTVSQKPS